MAGTTELVKRLDDDGEPLAKRLCLARNAFESTQLPLLRKEETVVNWFCKIAGKYRKKKKRDSTGGSVDDVYNLWSTLQSCIASPHMQRLGVTDIRPSAKANIVKVLSKHLERDDLPLKEHISVLECAVSILEANSFQRYFRTNISLGLNFVSLTLGSLSRLGPDSVGLCVRCVSSIQAISRQTILRNDLCTAFLDVVLLPLTKLLKAQGNFKTSPLSIETYKCIQQVLFPKTSLDFSRFLGEIYKESKKSADPTANLPCVEAQHPIPFKLLKVLKDAKDSLDPDSFVGLVSIIFRAFAASQKTNSASMVFKMAVTLSYLVGFEVKSAKCNVPYGKLKESIGQLQEDVTMISLGALHGMALTLAQWNIYLNGEICGSTFVNWLQMVVESLFPLPPSVTADVPFMELISTLVKLSPLIVEPNVKNILGAITSKQLSEEEIPVYSSLISKLLTMYMKLSRIPNFITVFLTSLHAGFKKQQECGKTTSEAWLPSNVGNELAQFATTMPSTSSISTLTILLDQLYTNGLKPYLDGQDPSLSLSDGFRDLFLSCVCELMCSFLSGVRMLEQCTAVQARRGYCNFLKQLKDHLSSFGRYILNANAPNSSAFSSFLNLSYHWAAEALLIEQYAEIGREELLESVGTNLQKGSQTARGGGIFSYLHPYLTEDEWENLYSLIVENEGDRCKNLLLKLDLQLLSALRMFDASRFAEHKEVATRACELMVKKFYTGGVPLFDQSLTTDVLLLSPLLDVSGLTSLSDSIAFSLITNLNGDSTSETISPLLEDRLMACGLTCSILTSLRQCLKLSTKDVKGVKLWKTAKAVLGKLDAEIIVEGEIEGRPKAPEQLSSLVSSMASVAQKALEDVNVIQSEQLGEESDLSPLSQHLKLLHSFPLAYLSVSSQNVIFISLLCVAVDCSLLPSSHYKTSILKEILDHLLPGLYERGIRLSPSLKSCMDYGSLVNGLAHFVIHHNAGRRLLESILGQVLRQEELQEQILEKVVLLKKKGKVHDPGRENLLLGTLLMQDLSGRKLKMAPSNTLDNTDESGDDPVNRLKRARKRLGKSFEALIESKVVGPGEALHAYALILDYKCRFDKELNNLIPHLEKFCLSAVSLLGSDECADQKAAETLLLAAFRHRKKLGEAVPSSLLRSVWSILIACDKPSHALVTAIFESASQEEMSYIVDNLLVNMDIYGEAGSEDLASKSLPNLMQFWLIILKCQNLPAVNNEISLKAMHTLLERLQSMSVLPHQQLLEFLQAVLSSTKFTMDMEMVDLCLSILHGVTLPSTVLKFAPVAEAFLSVLSSLLLHRSSHTLDCIPSFLQMLLLFVKRLALESKQTSELSREDAAVLSGLAFGVEKLVWALTKTQRKKSFRKPASYFLADIIAIFETITLCSAVKVHYQNMVFALLSITDEYAMKFLLRTMSSASSEIFKSLNESYKKFHRFSGKV